MKVAVVFWGSPLGVLPNSRWLSSLDQCNSQLLCPRQTPVPSSDVILGNAKNAS